MKNEYDTIESDCNWSTHWNAFNVCISLSRSYPAMITDAALWMAIVVFRMIILHVLVEQTYNNILS